ncbi:hypothetical protein, partial [Methyloglobulus sp.]|uniref:hypothetical protein n=1 Tax=Methyloglobulus sp. TaxID=2518622 RepID=UPI0032B7D201
MFYKNRLKSLCSLMIFAAICSISSHTYAKVIPKYPGCHNFAKLNLTVPLDFIAYLDETKNDDAGLIEAQEIFRMSNHNGVVQNTEWMAVIPDLEHRLMLWRVATKRSVDGTTDECQNQPNSLAPILLGQPFAAAVAPPIKPQHSLAKNIFRKQSVVIQLFDDGIVDGDIVSVYLNGALVRARVPLLKYPGIAIPLTLKESALLPGRVNLLKVLGVYGGTAFPEFFKATPGISISLGNAGSIVRGGPLLDVFPSAIFLHDPAPRIFDGVTIGKFSDTVKMGLGLVCYDPFSTVQAQSTKHAVDALAGVKDIKGRQNKSRIVTIDRIGSVARGRRSTAGYPPAGLLKQNDEFPPKVFKGIPELAHVRSILASDNLSFGNYIKSTITGPGSTPVVNALYKDGNQVELIV